MPQPPSKPWKRTIFTAIALAEHALRGDNALSQTNPQQIRNFLFLQYESPLGSVIHATPVFEALRRALLDCHIAVALSPMAAGVLRLNPYIDRCIVAPRPVDDFRGALGALREILRLVPPGPKCIVTTVGNQRTRVALLAVAAGSALRAGYTLAPELYDIPLSFDPMRGQIESNLDILRNLGHTVPFYEPRIFFQQQDAEYASELLNQGGRSPDAPRIAFVTQNSGGQPNQWSQERFQQTIASLTRICNAIPIFLGTAADSSAIQSLRESLPDRGISAAGKTTVPQLAALLALCDLVVSLDTGTFHVARAVGLPGVVIAPAWQSPLEWLPVEHPHYCVLRGPSIAMPPAGYWIEEIGAQEAIDAALDLLKKFPPGSAFRAARVERSTTLRQ